MQTDLATLIEELGSLDIGIQQKATAKLEALGHKALHPLVDALKHPNGAVRSAASRLITRLVQQQDALTSPLVGTEPELTLEHAVDLVVALRSPAVPNREQIEQQLLAQRVIAVPALIEALATASPIHATRIAKLLTRLQAVEAIPALIAYLNQDKQYPRDGAVGRALSDLFQFLPKKWRALGLNALLRILETNPYPHSGDASLDDALATVLAQIAIEEPTPQLRIALKYLRRPWYVRTYYFELARRAVEEGTRQWKDLPLPVLNSEGSASLPLPAESAAPSVADLPRPLEPK